MGRSLPHYGRSPDRARFFFNVQPVSLIISIIISRSDFHTHLAPSLTKIKWLAGRMQPGATFGCSSNAPDVAAGIRLTISQHDVGSGILSKALHIPAH